MADELIMRLRSDLAKAAEGGTIEFCEGCDAPIFADEEAATTEDVRGCWGYVADVRGAPCYRYRTVKGCERSWPDCPLAASPSAPLESEK